MNEPDVGQWKKKLAHMKSFKWCYINVSDKQKKIDDCDVDEYKWTEHRQIFNY